MKQTVIIINESVLKPVSDLLNKNFIDYRVAGFPNGKVKVIESFNSKINEETITDSELTKIKEKYDPKNRHDEMLVFAKKIGYSSVSGAMLGVGSPRLFKKRFKEEYKK